MVLQFLLLVANTQPGFDMTYPITNEGSDDRVASLMSKILTLHNNISFLYTTCRFTKTLLNIGVDPSDNS